MRIAVTGTVGSGKSGVAALLAGLLHAEYIDTDQLCRELMKKGEAGWLELYERWPHFFDSECELNRTRLREEVFTSAEVRTGLENILHPKVRNRVSEKLIAATELKETIVVEVPLLFEAGWSDEFDLLVTVYVPDEISTERTILRDRVPLEQAEAILALQLPAEEKASRADIVIDNSGLWAATVMQVSRISTLLQAAGMNKKAAVERL